MLTNLTAMEMKIPPRNRGDFINREFPSQKNGVSSLFYNETVKEPIRSFHYFPIRIFANHFTITELPKITTANF